MSDDTSSTTFEIEWVAGARPPIHPEPMKGTHGFSSFEKAKKFFLSLPDDASDVVLYRIIETRQDVTEHLIRSL